MDVKYRLLLTIALWGLCLAGGVGAQESLDKGKNPAQLFASDCSGCHKSAQGLAKAGGLFGLENFLRTHYTASRETAAAIANYVRSVDTGPAGPGRATRRAAKSDEKTKLDDRKKIGTRPADKRGERSNPTGQEPTSSERKPSDILAPEPKAQSRANAPAAREAKPAGGAKPEKSD
jgi:hypothetical protein